MTVVAVVVDISASPYTPFFLRLVGILLILEVLWDRQGKPTMISRHMCQESKLHRLVPDPQHIYT